MKTNIKDIARQIARMSKTDISELESALMENNISATLYRFSPADSMWDNETPMVPTPGYHQEEYYKVVLEWVPRNKKLQTVKALKDHFGQALGLREAKNMVDNTPSTVKEHAPRIEAEKIGDVLDSIGCDVEIIRNDEIH